MPARFDARWRRRMWWRRPRRRRSRSSSSVAAERWSTRRNSALTVEKAMSGATPAWPEAGLRLFDRRAVHGLHVLLGPAQLAHADGRRREARAAAGRRRVLRVHRRGAWWSMSSCRLLAAPLETLAASLPTRTASAAPMLEQWMAT